MRGAGYEPSRVQWHEESQWISNLSCSSTSHVTLAEVPKRHQQKTEGEGYIDSTEEKLQTQGAMLEQDQYGDTTPMLFYLSMVSSSETQARHMVSCEINLSVVLATNLLALCEESQ